MAGTLIAIVQTRLELITNEIQEERLHIGKMMIYGSVVLLFFSLSIMLLTVLIVVLFWDYHRIEVLSWLTVLFLVAGLWFLNLLRCKARDRHQLFSSSLAELSDDRECLNPTS
jgi:uncharacterized membrane protein YqjE